MASLLDIYYENLSASKTKVAVTDLFDEISFEELEKESNDLARKLLTSGIRENDLVPICIENCIERTIAVLAVMKCSAGYILIDLNEWEKKCAIIQGYSSSKIVISEIENVNYFDKEWFAIARSYRDVDFKSICEFRSPTENSLLCAHFTSGSTGVPKLAFLQHFDGIQMINAKKQIMDMYGVKKSILYLSQYFAFGTEVYLANMVTGRTLVCIEDFDKGNILSVFQFIEDNSIDMAELPVSLVNTISKNYDFIENLPSNLKVINVAGESLYLTPYLEDTLHKKQIQLFFEYGSSEMMLTFINNVSDLAKRDDGLVSLGQPIQGCKYIIQDNHLVLIRIGKRISDFLSMRQDLMYVNKGDEVCYNTMDLVQIYDNEMYIQGRANRCVKIRGFRVNLSEIEYVIRSKIVGAEVFAGYIETKQHVKQIGIVYVENDQLNPSTINNAITENLEKYKCPQVFVKTNEIPKTKNGKNDYQACMQLLQIEFDLRMNGNALNAEKNVREIIERYSGPLTDEELQLEFSDINVDSLSLITIICEIEEELKIKLDLEQLAVKWINTPRKLIESIIDYEFD